MTCLKHSEGIAVIDIVQEEGAGSGEPGVGKVVELPAGRRRKAAEKAGDYQTSDSTSQPQPLHPLSSPKTSPVPSMEQLWRNYPLVCSPSTRPMALVPTVMGWVAIVSFRRIW